MTNAADFCELAAQALATEVFGEPLFVVGGASTKLAANVVSCRLRFRDSGSQIIVHNSSRACRWFTRPATGWHADARTQPSTKSGHP